MSTQRKGPADHLDANGYRPHLDEWGRDVNRPLSEEEPRARDRQDARFARLRVARARRGRAARTRETCGKPVTNFAAPYNLNIEHTYAWTDAKPTVNLRKM